MYPGNEREARGDGTDHGSFRRRYEAETRLIEGEAGIRWGVLGLVFLMAVGTVVMTLTQKVAPWSFAGFAPFTGYAFWYLGRRPSVLTSAPAEIRHRGALEQGASSSAADPAAAPDQLHARRGPG